MTLNYGYIRSAVTVGLLGAWALGSTALVSITSEDILGQIGSSRVLEQDSSGAVTVNVGSAGANQTWDFSDVDLPNSLMATFEQLDPVGTPFASEFAAANMVEKISLEGTDGAIYNYRLVEGDRFLDLGSGSEFNFMGMTFSQTNHRQRTLVQLPLTFGDTWTEVTSDTTADVVGITTIVYDSSVNMVDAWGTVILPEGSFQALRLRTDATTTTTTTVTGLPPVTTTSSDINYFWATKDSLLIATATSQDMETDPNFTMASFFSRMSSGGATPTQDFDLPYAELWQNTPNPFRESTEIGFVLDRSQEIALSIIDAKGLTVRVLAEGWHQAGEHMLTWNGLDSRQRVAPPGVYYYMLVTAQGAETKSLTLAH